MNDLSLSDLHDAGACGGAAKPCHLCTGTGDPDDESGGYRQLPLWTPLDDKNARGRRASERD